ncbi:1-deoxy-D-xylulose-5-phosphate reductoisomerase [Rhizomicrobium palustre]|uniref:1-deoxy-D-xylulose 5-phosphate reductoisomerase n=1 Tax=Rhizomicrobium palustre TaxID=189966 RepID=A0A846N3D7_9PROT|nr:1-deoxy-D-xylulose-5-phosphate reductoisomerase [Rhizomicrobium palustre]NIK89590.1 1-deoxy-D-xylulose-5-phosphate reductoisomerase [Rhizomicrobium palustre]
MRALAAPRGNAEIPDLSGVLHRSVTVLGSTGSIGVSTLDVIAHARATYGADAFPLEALTAGGNVDKLIEQAKAAKPKLAVIADEKHFAALKDGLSGTGIEVAAGRKAVIEASARPSDTVMVAIMGAAALEPALAAVARSANVALANKECIVAAGTVFHRVLAASKATVLPVDSEHNAVFQLYDAEKNEAVEKVTLTASGGPFRTWDIERIRAATPAQAVAHPNWSMGAKISVDSATLMNKGLELIEAHFLFALPAEKLGVVVHPQSIVHAMVTFEDGSTLAHLSAPDMRTPICHALAWPRRISSPSRRLDLPAVGQLTFEAPDTERFRCLKLAIETMDRGCMSPTILNAANEIAVDAFLKGRIGFMDIAHVVEDTLNDCPGANIEAETVEGVLYTDLRAREVAAAACARRQA